MIRYYNNKIQETFQIEEESIMQHLDIIINPKYQQIFHSKLVFLILFDDLCIYLFLIYLSLTIKTTKLAFAKERRFPRRKTTTSNL